MEEDNFQEDQGGDLWDNVLNYTAVVDMVGEGRPGVHHKAADMAQEVVDKLQEDGGMKNKEMVEDKVKGMDKRQQEEVWLSRDMS